MSIPFKPWTFEPLELHQEMTWEVYDPNTAQQVASFHDFDRAREYLAWINRKQAKKKAKKAHKTLDGVGAGVLASQPGKHGRG